MNEWLPGKLQAEHISEEEARKMPRWARETVFGIEQRAGRLSNRLLRLLAEREELRGLLKEIQWYSFRLGDEKEGADRCLFCEWTHFAGHDEGCRLAAVLGEE
jgi:hypothetical protein